MKRKISKANIILTEDEMRPVQELVSLFRTKTVEGQTTATTNHTQQTVATGKETATSNILPNQQNMTRDTTINTLPNQQNRTLDTTMTETQVLPNQQNRTLDTTTETNTLPTKQDETLDTTANTLPTKQYVTLDTTANTLPTKQYVTLDTTTNTLPTKQYMTLDTTTNTLPTQQNMTLDTTMTATTNTLTTLQNTTSDTAATYNLSTFYYLTQQNTTLDTTATKVSLNQHTITYDTVTDNSQNNYYPMDQNMELDGTNNLQEFQSMATNSLPTCQEIIEEIMTSDTTTTKNTLPYNWTDVTTTGLLQAMYARVEEVNNKVDEIAAFLKIPKKEFQKTNPRQLQQQGVAVSMTYHLSLNKKLTIRVQVVETLQKI